MSRERTSFDSIREATENKTVFSGHGNSFGVAGYRDHGNIIAGPSDFLSETGQSKTISIPEGRFPDLRITLAWNNIAGSSGNIITRLFKRLRKSGIDLDLGCLYELTDGTRGAVQAFGDKFGDTAKPPFIHHTGDERTGDKPGDDEALEISGQYWEKIKRLLVYTYVYDGPADWSRIKPEMRLVLPGETPMIVTLNAHRGDLPICALATIENLYNGVRLTNNCEYFSSQGAMDRAFGYGIAWEDGHK